jgi:hypothetical protein
MSEREQQRIKQLKKEIIQDYDSSSQAKKIFRFDTMRASDSSFMVIYQRPLVERKWFRDEGYYPAFGSLGGGIARGEVDYSISCLKRAVQPVALEETEFTLDWLRSVIATLSPEGNTISLVGSVENVFQKIIQNNEWKSNYDDALNGFKVRIDDLDVPLHAIAKEIVGDNIIILNKECCRVKYRIFRHSDLETSSTLFIDIRPYETDPEKMDILVHSTVRLDMYTPSLLKIFSLGPAIGEPLMV